MIDFVEFVCEKGIKYFMIFYIDLFGGQCVKLVLVQVIVDMQVDGVGFVGFVIWLDLMFVYFDMIVLFDVFLVIQLLWKKDVVWVVLNCVMVGGGLLDQVLCNVLVCLVIEVVDLGFEVKIGVELEFFLLIFEGMVILDVVDIVVKFCYDQQVVMCCYDVIVEICDYMLELGWEVYQNDYEDVNGQFEMNWKYDGVMVIVDKYSFFKFMICLVVEKYGLCVIFMFKLIMGLMGNGCYVYILVWIKDGKNVFVDDSKELLLFDQGWYFFGGIMKYVLVLVVIINLMVNSYKCINVLCIILGVIWVLNLVIWIGNNCMYMVCVFGFGWFELCLFDGVVNFYLLQVVIIVVGFLGLKFKVDLGKCWDIDMYVEGYKVMDVLKLLLNFLDVICVFDVDDGLKQVIGVDFLVVYIKLKMQEWNVYIVYLMQWECDNIFDI